MAALLEHHVKARQALEAAKERAALADAVRSTTRMLAVLDSHIEYLESKRAKAGLEFLQIPSRNQQFWHVMDRGGVVRLHQDPAFVVEQVFISAQGANLAGSYFTMTDVSAYRSTTVAYRPGGNNIFSADNAMPTDSVLVPVKVLVPQNDGGPGLGLSDYWYVLPAEWQLPRGGAIQFAFLGLGSMSYDPSNYDVVLTGHKVFG